MASLAHCLKLHRDLFPFEEMKALRVESRDLAARQNMPAEQAMIQTLENHADELQAEYGKIEKVIQEHFGITEIKGEPPKPKAVPAKKEKPAATPGLKLANWVNYELNQNHPITWRDLYKAADMFYNGTQAKGAYTSRDAFDAMELGLNLWVTERIRSGMDIISAIKLLDKKQQLLSTQAKRTKEQVEFQQFSTPPTHSRAMAWAANIGPNDVVLEPSAGTGSLVAQALVDQPAEVIANELNARRAKLLENLGVKVYTENAAHLDAVLPAEVKPTVILMNPPFSSDVLLKGKKKTTGTGAEHIEQALMRLEDGGRLVALAGRGMALDKPAFRKWWKGIRDQYNVKAIVEISGKEYKKFGTTFDNVVIVIDKTGPTDSVTDIVAGSVDRVEEVIPLLEGIRDERIPAGERKAVEPVVEKGAERIEGEAGPKQPVRGATDVVGVEGEAGPVQPGQLPGPPGRGGVAGISGTKGVVGVSPSRRPTGEPGTIPSGELGKRGPRAGRPGAALGEPATPSLGDRRPGIPDQEIADGVFPDLEFVENKPTGEKGELTDSLFENYVPSVKVEGLQKHPAPIAESAAMAAVEAPKVSRKPKIPQNLITSGKLSDVQFEFVARAGEVHEQIMPDGQRAGIALSDGTGVGKGAQQAGVILDNWNHGRKKAVWISEKMSLVKETKRDLDWVGMDGDKITFIPKVGEKIKKDEGVLYTTYSTLASEPEEKQKRLDQIVEWLGRDFDGVICFDESHNMANSMEQKGARGSKPPSKKAIAGIHLQDVLPNARIVYASATAATEVENLAYAERLGLWGEGTAFASKGDFIQAIKSGGIAAMEVVASNLKSMGRLVSRTLAYNVPGNSDQTVTYETLTHKVTGNDKKIYDEMARAWQIVLKNIDAALEETGGDQSSAAKRSAMGQFWGAQQRFFSQVLTSLPAPSLIKDMERQLAEGNSCVLQLYNTNEALAERRRAQAEEAGLDLEDIDITPRDMLMQYLQKSFPVNLWEEYWDAASESTQTRQVKDSVGNLVQDPRAVARRDELMKDLAGLAVPETVMERIVNHFGSDSVAEVTGRKRRLVRQPDGTVIEEKMTPSSRARDIDAFMDKKKRILIFSNAGGTGKGYHSDLDCKNQEKRIHYLVQAGWVASRALQGFGRTHRTNQRFAPHNVLVTTDIAAHKRFFSSIARRLDQLGALTKGERRTTGQGMFSAEMNLENEYADMALSVLFDDLQAGRVGGLELNSVVSQMGFGDISEVRGDLIQGLNLNMQKFLNRMLSMEIDEQNKLFDAFFERLEAQVQYAVDQGIYESGIETLRADKVEKISEQNVDVPVGKTKYTELDLTYPLHPVTYKRLENNVAFGERSSSFARNKRSGKLYFFRRGVDATQSDGTIVRRVVRISPTATTYMNQSDVSEEKYEQIPKGQRAKKIWDAQVAAAPKTEIRKEHLISGTLLPIWDRLPNEIPKIARVRTDEGEVILGRRIASAHLAKTKRALSLGVEAGAEITSKQALDALLENDATLVLANSWTIKTRTVSGEDRIEIAGPTGPAVNMLESFGAFTEIIGYKLRVFVPLDQAAEIIERVVKSKPVVEIQGPRGGAVREAEAAYKTESAPAMYSALTSAAESKKIPEKMFAKGVVNRLRKAPGVKQAEIDTVGLVGWLESKKIVTKRELVEFLKQAQGQAVMEPEARYRQSEIDLAFGGKKKADEAIEAVAKEIDRVSRRGVPDIRELPVTKTKVVKDLREKKRVDFSGRKLTKGNEYREIAELFQVYRSPKVEILHAIYTAKDGTILAHGAITSGELSGVQPDDISRYVYRLRATAKRLGAAKVHLLHNHPSGDPTMSKEDVALACMLRPESRPGRNTLGSLMGEFIVIDHGKFTWVSEYIKDGAYVLSGNHEIAPGTGAWMEKKGPRLSGPLAVASFGQSLAYDKTKACFVYVDQGNNVVGWSTHDKKILEKSVPDLEKTVRQQAKGHNAAKAIIIADDKPLLGAIVRYGGVGDWLLDVQDVDGVSWRQDDPGAFEVERKPLKPARGVLEPETPYGDQEVIAADGTTVDWKKTMVLLKQKVFGTYKKDGSFNKWCTRSEISKIKALKKAKAKYKEQLGKAKERFDVKVGKIKTAKDILQRRRQKIRDIRDYFSLSDSDLRKITGKDIRFMSNFEFKQFIDDIRVKAEKFAERRQALNELELLRKEKEFIAENNIRIFHKLPTIEKMTTEQLVEYAGILSGYEKGDQFLTPKRVKGLEQTPWSGSKTLREVLEKAAVEFDVPLSELGGIRVDEIDRFRYDTAFARQNPFYNFMVDTLNIAKVKNQFKYFREREKLYNLGKAALKSRKRGIIGRLVPQQKELMKYMEAEGEAKIAAATELTTEEMALADAIEDFYRRAYNWLLVCQELKSSRFADSKYVFHSKRPLSEMLVNLKDTGIRSAARDLLNRWRLDEAQFKILDSKTGEILRMKKFFRQTLYRTGELTPTKNVIRATDIYMQQFFKKMALDESVPAIETLAMALRPKETTKTGVFLNDSLMTLVKEYLNNKKGRTISVGIQQGGKIDTVIRFVNQMISLRYIALNIPLQVAAIIGETTAKLPALGNRRLILANTRRHTPRGRRILKKYKAFTGEGVFEEVLQPARNIGENMNMVLYGLFKWSRKITKQDILLGNMTKKEFEAETIDPKKLAEATKLAGRWIDIEGSESIIGSTSTGASITKFKGWAIPIAVSTIHDATSLARTLTRLGDPKKRLTRQQFQELYRIAEMGAIVCAVMSLSDDDDDDGKGTFFGKLKHYAIRELGTLFNALTPWVMLSFGVTVAFLEKLSKNLHLLMTLEKYKTRDEFKGTAALKKQLTPAAVSQFIEKKKPEPKTKKSRLTGGLSGGSLKSGLKSGLK